MKPWSMFPLELRRFGMGLQFWGEDQDKGNFYKSMWEGFCTFGIFIICPILPEV